MVRVESTLCEVKGIFKDAKREKDLLMTHIKKLAIKKM